MTSALRVGRRSKRGRQEQARPSVREVCLIGVPRPLEQGDRVTWSGRAYRVEATDAGYAHLATEPDQAAGRG